MKTTKRKGSPKFCGSNYDPKLDEKRLSGQMEKIFNLMKDGTYRTLKEIEKLTGYPQSSISAQLRHLRKPMFGEFIVNKQRRIGRKTRPTGTWEYALKVNP